MEQELSDSLLVIADRLGVAAENIFSIFSAVQPVIGVISIAASVFGVIFAICAGFVMHRYLLSVWKEKDGSWKAADFAFWEPFLCIVTFLVGCLLFTEMLSLLGENILRIVAPDYMAAKEIIGMLRP